MNFFTPAECIQNYMGTGEGKCKNKPLKVFVLAILAGIFIGYGAASSTTAAHAITNVGLARLVSGAVFPVGLIMVILMGAELFTGDCLIAISVLGGRVKVGAMIKTLVIVYIGNFVGSIILALIVANAGALNYSSGALAANVVKIAVGKCSLSFGNALLSGILCNIIVCMAVIMAAAGKSVGCKILATYFPILAFVTAGFEHSVANMYYITVALFANAMPKYAEAIVAAGVDTTALTWGNLFVKNLIPVTIGNIIGGVFIGFMLWYGHSKKAEKAAAKKK